ncbi:MAG: periplasmic heavy metal sensor [Rhodobacteraceae bacterium]|jgi:uncharacterized membrane protein|nr:periplasmic heavy metal sensor [Paracoccaceae bacterium]
MTDIPPASAAPAATRTWIKVLLALSLALNLGIAGLAAGALLRHHDGPRGEHDYGLGPIGDALTREDRKALRQAFVSAHPDLGRRGLAALRADFDPLLVALRASPFDPAALDAALRAMADRNAERLETGRRVIADYLTAMSPTARAAFADRLESVLARAEKRKNKDRTDGERD